MSNWQILPKQEHHKVFDLLEREVKVQTRWHPKGEWFDVTLGASGDLWTMQPITKEYESLFIGKERDFRYQDTEWWDMGTRVSAKRIEELLEEGRRVQVRRTGCPWCDVICHHGMITIKTLEAVSMCTDDKWRATRSSCKSV